MTESGTRVPDVGIELRSWRQFLVLAQTLHFGRAAKLAGAPPA